MLPLQLLRVHTNKGNIHPLFCSEEDCDVLLLAKDLIDIFRQSANNKKTKMELDRQIERIESQYNDYKLVRGFSALLEKRCQFRADLPGIDKDEQSNSTNSTSNNIGPHLTNPNPQVLRKMLFEESARLGLALTDHERNKVIESVSSKTNLSSAYIQKAMWSDLEDNMILEYFDSIDTMELLGWYNLSLMQTLFFNCSKLEFSVIKGLNWKHVLRSVNRLGLMYYLQYNNQEKGQDLHVEQKEPRPLTTNCTNNSSYNMRSDLPETTSANPHLVCSIDGPLSLFKFTDRYGTSIARLIPSIVSSERWWVKAWIVRKTMDGKKIYEFNISSANKPILLLNPHSNQNHISNKRTELALFDSMLEEKFARRMEQFTSTNGWKLIREPEPIIVSGGRAFITDFAFEKYGRRVYLEIVGFWTREYLQRKVQKLADVISGSGINNKTANGNIDLFIAVNEGLSCSGINSLPRIAQDRIITYRSDTVPVKRLIDYLKRIDQEEIERCSRYSNPKLRFDPNREDHSVISIESIAQEFDIPLEAAIKIAMRENEQDYVKAGLFLISKVKSSSLSRLLEESIKFSDACSILSNNGIPEACHAELVSKLGYDVIWKDMDANSAVIIRHEK